ncbi:MAG: crossover junction endodeoxyribonuclease RuvC [Burkholderiaceae bacterium]
MRILGVDPGLRVTGFGLIDCDGQSMRYVTSGVIRTPEGELPQRLAVILEGLAEVIRKEQPDQGAIEKVFVNVNSQSTLLLGQARGAAICAMVTAQLPVSEYTALQTKQATVGHGKAKKDQVQQMVRRLLNLPGAPSADAADALACAICHANARAAVASLAAVAPSVARRGLRMRGGRVTG